MTKQLSPLRRRDRELGAAEERARIVEWLRNGGNWLRPWPLEVMEEYPQLADDIEKGEHLK